MFLLWTQELVSFWGNESKTSRDAQNSTTCLSAQLVYEVATASFLNVKLYHSLSVHLNSISDPSISSSASSFFTSITNGSGQGGMRQLSTALTKEKKLGF